jgi:hypothetical protein
MPESFNEDGSLKWFDITTQTQTSQATVSFGGGFFTSLYACSIQTNVINRSIQIIIDDMAVAHIQLKGIVAFDLVGDTILLETSDEFPYTLQFVDNIEATKAHDNIDRAINGEHIGCSEAPVSTTIALKFYSDKSVVGSVYNPYPCLLFFNDTPLIKVNSQAEAVIALNDISDGYYFCSAGGSLDEFIFSHLKWKEKYIPVALQIIDTFFTCQVKTQDVFYTFDGESWVYKNLRVTHYTTSAVEFSFDAEGVHFFDVFYTKQDAEIVDLSGIGLITLTNKLPSKLKQLTIINSTVSELNVLTPLTELQTLEIINSSLTSLPSFATGKTKLQNLILVDSNVSSLSNFHNLPALMLLHIENCPITATPIMTASTELRYMRFINCDFLLTVNALSVYTKLIQLEVSGKIISVFGVPLTVNTQLESISITETNIQTLPSFSTLTKLNYVDLSFNNLTVDAIKDVVAQISAAVITTNGTLNISNQQQYIDYENLGQTYKDNVDILKTNKQWTVIAKLDDFTYI